MSVCLCVCIDALEGFFGCINEFSFTCFFVLSFVPNRNALITNVFRTGPVIEPEKLLVHGSWFTGQTCGRTSDVINI